MIDADDRGGLLRVVTVLRSCIAPWLLISLLLAANTASAQQENAATPLVRTARFPELAAVILVVVAGLGAYRIVRRRGRPMLRPLPPMRAIPEAVGRATEIGTPIVYITGWGGDMGRPTTMASMGILSQVALQAAQHNCRLLFPSHDPVIATVAEDTIAQSATLAGRPEWVSMAESTFVTQSQFGYAAAIEGIVAREHPGAVMLLGTFEGEALILAEAAHQSGAMTIAGTDSTIQLSFFLVACDYTLIGEELFAAAGALSQDPDAIAGIWAQDWLKYVALLVLIAGAATLWLSGFDPGRFLAR